MSLRVYIYFIYFIFTLIGYRLRNNKNTLICSTKLSSLTIFTSSSSSSTLFLIFVLNIVHQSLICIYNCGVSGMYLLIILFLVPGLLHQHCVAVLQVPDAEGPGWSVSVEVLGRSVWPGGSGESDPRHGPRPARL